MRKTQTLIAAALMCSVAPVSFAQEPAQNPSQQSCQRLQQLTEQNRERFRDEWVTAANDVFQQGNTAQCARYVTQAERAARQLDAREAAAGRDKSQQQRQAQGDRAGDDSRIIVTQPEPQITVDQAAPEILLNQPRPQVTVNQPQPEIIVRQARPTVRVQIPQPTITIDQPQPEIIVRMPEPEVAVNVPEPEIEVSQQQPEVQVEQAQPQVRVDLEQPEVNVRDSEQAQVQVERGQPVVRRTNPETEAQVNVEQAQPKVSYQRAEPRVEVESSGEPKVQFSSSGEPKIRYERLGDQAAESGDRQGQQETTQAQQDRSAQPAQQTARAQPNADQTTSIGDQHQLSSAARQRLGGFDPNEPAGEMSAMEVGDILNRDVVNRRGEELGSIERVVTRSDRHYVVLSHGGFLGLGEREVALPLDRLSVNQGRDELIMRGMSEEDLDDLPRFDMNTAEELRLNQSVEISQG